MKLSAECEKAVQGLVQSMRCNNVRQAGLAHTAGVVDCATTMEAVPCVPSNGQDAETFSKVSITFCMCLRRLAEYAYKTAYDKNYDEFSCLHLANYESWFLPACVYFTYTWKDLSESMVEKAIKQDPELQQAADIMDVARSAFNVLSVCKGICDDYNALQLHNMQTRVMCVIKLTDVMCDNVLAYSSYMYRTVAARPNTARCKLLRAANSIKHVTDYMAENLSDFLNYRKLLFRLEPDQQQLVDGTLSKIINSCVTNSTNWADKMLCDFVFRFIQPELDKIIIQLTGNQQSAVGRMQAFMKTCVQELFDNVNSQRVAGDNLMVYVDRTMFALSGTLLKSLMPHACTQIWKCAQRLIKTKEYLKRLKIELEKVGNQHGENEGLDSNDEDVFRLPLHGTLVRWLHLNSLSSEELILEVIAARADVTESRSVTSESCSLRLRVGYIRLSGARMLITVNVVNGRNFPALDTLTNSSDPYIHVHLSPSCVFPSSTYKHHVTAINYESLNPTFDETFTFDIPEQQFFTYGTSLCIIGLDHDTFSKNDIAGVAYLHLQKIPFAECEDQAVEIEFALEPLTEEELMNSVAWQLLQILRNRRSNDAVAREQIDSDVYLAYFNKLPPSINDNNDFGKSESHSHFKSRIWGAMMTTYENVTKSKAKICPTKAGQSVDECGN